MRGSRGNHHLYRPSPHGPPCRATPRRRDVGRAMDREAGRLPTGRGGGPSTPGPGKWDFASNLAVAVVLPCCVARENQSRARIPPGNEPQGCIRGGTGGFVFFTIVHCPPGLARVFWHGMQESILQGGSTNQRTGVHARRDHLRRLFDLFGSRDATTSSPNPSLISDMTELCTVPDAQALPTERSAGEQGVSPPRPEISSSSLVLPRSTSIINLTHRNGRTRRK